MRRPDAVQRYRSEANHYTVGKRQDPGLEELCLPNRDGAVAEVNVTKIKSGQFASPQTRAISQQQHGIHVLLAKCSSRRWIGSRNVEHPSQVGR